MTKTNHVLAAYDGAGNFRVIGSPVSYGEGNEALKAGVAVKDGEKAALVSLRGGVVKRRPGAKPAAKKAAKKTTK